MYINIYMCMSCTAMKIPTCTSPRHRLSSIVEAYSPVRTGRSQKRNPSLAPLSRRQRPDPRRVRQHARAPALPSGTPPPGILPSGIAPSGIAPSGIPPSDITPSGITPPGIAPPGPRA